jgi:hypothetical protein
MEFRGNDFKFHVGNISSVLCYISEVFFLLDAKDY